MSQKGCIILYIRMAQTVVLTVTWMQIASFSSKVLAFINIPLCSELFSKLNYCAIFLSLVEVWCNIFPFNKIASLPQLINYRFAAQTQKWINNRTFWCKQWAWAWERMGGIQKVPFLTGLKYSICQDPPTVNRQMFSFWPHLSFNNELLKL